jgi:hypothetical protein
LLFLARADRPTWAVALPLSNSDLASFFPSVSLQLQPQPPAPQAHEPPEEAETSLAALAPFDFVRALKTESCSAPRLLAHFGHETAGA